MGSRIGIVVIATSSNYVNYANKLISSIADHFQVSEEVDVLVLTDLPSKIKNPSARLNVHLVEIESLAWPYATLLRYRLIMESSKLLNHDYIFYMDSDLLVLQHVTIEDFLKKEERLFLVRHPGYYGRGFLNELSRRFIYPPWETNALSCARVPWFKRKRYFAGGLWGGKSQSVLDMVSTLEKRVNVDLQNNFFARSFDESHLNWWASRQKGFKILSPEYLYANGFPGMKKIEKPKILAVQKDSSTVLQKQSDYLSRFD